MMYAKGLAALLILAALAAGVWKLIDYGGDTRESAVRLEWAEEKLSLIDQRDRAIKEAADNRKLAETEKQENQKRGDKAIVQTRYIDRVWSDTHLPSGLYETLRTN